MMFTRDALEVLSETDCRRLLQAHQMGIGRIAFDDGLPIILPINYIIDADRIVFRSDDGAKLQAAREGLHMAFEIDNASVGAASAGPSASPLPLVRGWWSVLVRGRSSVVADADEAAYLRLARLQPEAGGLRTTFLAIAIDQVTGRHIPAR